LLNTGVTRGKKLVALVGQKKAVAIAVRNVSGRRRWSKLSGWLTSKEVMAGVVAWRGAQDGLDTQHLRELNALRHTRQLKPHRG
jgi:hypothetical protein